MQMAERRATASTHKLSPVLFSYSAHELSQPRGKTYIYLFECMDVCLPDNPPKKMCRDASRGGLLLHTYLKLVFMYRLLSHNIIVYNIHELHFFLPSVSVSILYYVTISNVPAPIIQVKCLLHLLYPTWQTKGFLFLLLSALIQFINSDMSAGNDARMLNFYSFLGLNGVASKAGQVAFK